MLCDDLDGWEVGIGGSFKREGIYVYIQLIYSAGKQKITQHCKATIKKKKVAYIAISTYLIIHCCQDTSTIEMGNLPSQNMDTSLEQ